MSQSPTRPTPTDLTPWLDTAAIGTWGLLLLHFWVSGKLYLLIHPNYMGLTIVTAILLLILAAYRILRLILRPQSRQPDLQHLSLFNPRFGSLLLLLVALAGFVITPQAFASKTAADRGIADSLTNTRIKPQAFRANVRSEDKSITEWVRGLNAYPEPDAYAGQKVRVKGFVSPNASPANSSPANSSTPNSSTPNSNPANSFLISRFVITCCAADAYPIGLPVKLAPGTPMPKADTWLEVQGQMIVEAPQGNPNGERKLVIAATQLTPIPEPAKPYDY
jgi:uncharacterized membrane protein YcgQ (UPF0703/DUF1980 family)